MDLPFLLDTYNAIKSVPPVEARPFNAKTIHIPYKNPPNITFNISSFVPKKGLKFKMSKNVLLKNTCSKE